MISKVALTVGATGLGRFRLGRDGKLLAWLMLIFIAAIVACFLGRREVQHFLMKSETEETAVRWAMFLSSEISDLDGLVNSGSISEDDRLVFKFASDAGRIFRYKVFGPDGTIVFASRTKDLGKKTDKPYFRELVQKGENYVKIEEEEDFGEGRKVVGEAYVPYMDGARFKGAVEVYVDMSANAAALEKTADFVMLALIAVLSLIGIVCGAFVWRNIKERDRELHEVVESRQKMVLATVALRENEERLAGILDIAAEAVISVDESRCIQLFNQGAEATFGYDADEALGQPLDMLLPARFRATHDQKIDKFARSSDATRTISERSEIHGLRKDGSEFLAEASISHLEQGNDTLFTIIMHDITDRRRTEQELIEAKEEADLAKEGAELAKEEAELAKEEAELANLTKSEFLANMSHELRTPLNAIIGFSEVILHETFGPVGSAKYIEYVGDIHASGAHLLSLINDVLDLSKVESGKAELYEEKIDVARVIDVAHSLIKERAHSRSINLVREVAPELPNLFADERKLKQILINLLSNAVKFTPPGGKVTVRVWYRPEAGYVFQVIDTGIGIALEDIPNALTQFRQVDNAHTRKYDGTGLGLPLSKALVELHGGSLDLQSKVGEGTTVTVRFPSERAVDKESRSQPAGFRAVTQR